MEGEKLDQVKREIRAKQIGAIKKAVQMSLELLDELEVQKEMLQKKIRILKHDVFDLKDGRLDRIAERQELNEEAGLVSVIRVKKIIIGAAENVSPWYEEYDFKVLEPGCGLDCRLTSSLTKTHASGTYKLKDGSTRSL
jgi:hypothetical protein